MKRFIGVFQGNNMTANHYIFSLEQYCKVPNILYYDSVLNKVCKLSENELKDCVEFYQKYGFMSDDFADITVAINNSYVLESKILKRYGYFVKIFDKWYTIYYDGILSYSYTLKEDNKLVLNIKNTGYCKDIFSCDLTLDLVNSSVDFVSNYNNCPVVFKDLKDLDVSDTTIIETLSNYDSMLHDYVKDYLGDLRY